MKLNYDKKSKDPTYFIQQGIRIGKKTTTRNVCRIGKHSELLKITDDPLSYAKEQVAKYNKEAEKEDVTLELKIDYCKKLKPCDSDVSKSSQRNIGYFFLQCVYQKLELDDFFSQILIDRKIQFEANLVNRFMTYARILNPESKLATYENIDHYYEQPNFNYMHIPRTMDLMYANYGDYLAHLFKRSASIIKRDTSVCYYDCTNFYCETELEDDDYVDEVTGETIQGLRKYGFSKEHRPNPIVQMGLFVDGQGIPLTMCINHGSKNEQSTAIPLEAELLKMFDGESFVYCADAGLNSYDIRIFNSMGGRKFIVTQSVKKLSDELQKAVLDDRGYKLLSNDSPTTIRALKDFDKNIENNKELYNDRAYKILNADRAEDTGLYEYKELKNGTFKKVKAKGILKQDIIITFSRKMLEYQRTIRNRQIERAKKIIITAKPDEYKKGPNDVTRFIKAVSNDTENKKYVIDEELIKHEEKYDGFYAVATNLEDDPKNVLEANAQRYKIEDNFRMMKNNMLSRPMFHRTRERITAHFMICYTALLVYKILEAELSNKGYRFTIDTIVETLRNLEVANLCDVCYKSTYSSSKILTALNDVYKLDLDKEYYEPKVLNKKIKKIL